MTQSSKPLSPFTLRLSAEERAQLIKLAQDMDISQAAFIRAKVFDGLPLKTKKTSPTLDHAALAKLLMMLGESRMASNLNQLAKHANMGTLNLKSDEIEEQLTESYEAVVWMRQTLIKTLGLAS